MTRREAMRAFSDAARDCPQDDWTLQAAQCAWLDHVEILLDGGDITDAERANFIARVDTSGVKVTPQIAIGPPASEIIAAAKKLQPQLLVLGRHGHGGFI